jgi:hypothetical protein
MKESVAGGEGRWRVPDRSGGDSDLPGGQAAPGNCDQVTSGEPAWRRIRHPSPDAGWCVAVVVTVTSLALRINSPTSLRPQMGHDDGLFARLAGNVLEGNWLGPYDKLTLSKGPAYPLFIAGVYRTGVPLKLAEHLLQLLAAALVAAAVWRVGGSRALALVTYSVVALDPAHLGTTASILTRENFYGSLSLALVAAVLVVVSYVPSMARWPARWSVPAVALCGGALGLAGAAFQLSRDESLWILPALLMATTAGLATWRGTGGSAQRHAAVTAGIVGLAVATFSMSAGWVADRNQSTYGTSVTSDLASGEIARAYTQWQRVDVGAERRYVPVSRAQRGAVYAVSPAAAELEPALEGSSTAWFAYGCDLADVCSDYIGAYFVWALRDAGEATGHGATAAEAQRFFGRIADDIEAACGEEFPCHAPGVGPMPPLARVDAGDVVSSFGTATRHLLSYEVGSPTRDASGSGSTDAQWDTMVRVLRGVDHDRADYVAAEVRRLHDQDGVSLLMVVYRWASRVGVVLALAGLIAGVASRSGRQNPALLLAVATLLVAALARVGFVALIDATAYPAADNRGYLLPSYGFLVAFVVAGGWTLVDASRHAIAARRSSSDDPAPAMEADERADVPATAGLP